jgi:subtilisin family serine protease
VAGTIGAPGNDGLGGTGVNWNLRIRPVRVLGTNGSGSFFDIAQGVLYAAGLPAAGATGTVQAAEGAKIINMSLGGPGNSTTLHNAVISANSAGSLIIAAAGNQGTSVPQYPAAYPETISVSAVSPARTLSSFSSYGSTIDIAAPGGELANGFTHGVYSERWSYAGGAFTYEFLQGTSMAAPHVSGVAALLLAQDPSLSADQIRSRLMQYAVDQGPPGRDDRFGVGIVNARNSLTQTMEPPRGIYVQLVDATGRVNPPGTTVRATFADPSGAFEITELPDGDYFVYAGQYDLGTNTFSNPGQRWGAFGGSAVPTRVTVSGAGVYASSFDIGVPVEMEANDNLNTNNVLSLGGWMAGVTVNANSDVDYVRVNIPADGTYTFDAGAIEGSCGFALAEDTVLQLFDIAGNLIAQNDNLGGMGIDVGCSRITMPLTLGTYFLRVSGKNNPAGVYFLRARQQ